MTHFLNNIENINIKNISFSSKSFNKDNTVDLLYKYNDNQIDKLRLIYNVDSNVEIIDDYMEKINNSSNTFYNYKSYFLYDKRSTIIRKLINLLHSKIKNKQYDTYGLSDSFKFSLYNCNVFNKIDSKYIKYSNITNFIFNEILTKNKNISFILNIQLYFCSDTRYVINFNVDSIIINNIKIYNNLNNKPNNIHNYNFYGTNIDLQLIDLKNSVYYYNIDKSLEDNIIKLLEYEKIEYQINPSEYNKIIINYYEKIPLKILNILIDFKNFYISDFIKNQLSLLSDIFIKNKKHEKIAIIKIKNEFKIFEKIKNKEYLFNIVLNPIKNKNNNFIGLLDEYYNMIFILIRNIILEIQNIKINNKINTKLELNYDSSELKYFLNQTILGNNYERKSYENIDEDNLI